MIELSRDTWIRTTVILSLLIFIFVGIHLADDIVNQDLPPDVETAAPIFLIVFTLQVFATIWTWAGKRLGFALLGLISLLHFYGVYLSHLLEAGVRGFVGVGGGVPAGWTPVYVLSSLFGGVVTVAAVILTAYLLFAGPKRTQST